MLHALYTRWFGQPLVRPWALAAPILVLLICLPLLRPLRHPDLDGISDQELATLATVQALVEHRTLAIDQTSFAQTRDMIEVGGKHYASQPPVQSVILAGGYWVMYRLGLSFERNGTLVSYLLTLLGVTLPVALSSGLVYRMGRLFDLPRWQRSALGAVVVLGSGLVSYGVVLNPHAPAAALLLFATACLVYVMAIAPNPARAGGWLAMAGLFASLAAMIDLPAGVFAVLLMAVLLAVRWSMSLRIGAILLYLIGALPPLVLHAVLVVPLTGDLLPGAMHPELAEHAVYLGMVTSGTSRTDLHPSPLPQYRASEANTAGQDPPPPETPAKANEAPDVLTPEDFADASDWAPLWLGVGRTVEQLLLGFVGPHGLLTHFPIVAVALIGLVGVLRRHWPPATKALALVSLGGSVLTVCNVAATGTDWRDAMFAARWFVVFTPLLLFWSGAWLRQSHRPLAWTLAAILLAFSIAVSILGAGNPFPPEGYRTYTAAEALRQWGHPSPSITHSTLAGEN